MRAGQLRQVLSRSWLSRFVTQGAGAYAHQPQGSAFAQAQTLQLPHDLAMRSYDHYFALSASRIVSISSIELASSFLSFVLSIFSAFRRCASETFVLPNLAFQAQ